MTSNKHSRILLRGRDAWGKWRRKHSKVRPALDGICLKDLDLSGVDLIDAELDGATFENVNLTGANLSYAKLNNASFSATLDLANLYGAQLFDARINGDSSLSHTNLREANLGQARFVCLKSFNPVAGLFGQSTEIRLIPARLNKADFSKANLFGADLRYQDLREADFSGAVLHYTILSGADLRGAKLLSADLRGTELIGTHLRDADFTDATIKGVILCDTNLQNVKGLQSVKHLGPSSLSIETIYLSDGKIPENFLRGCGVPEIFIAQIHSLVSAEEGIQFYSCFISYSSNDEEFARRLYSGMRDARLRVWFAPEDMPGGKKLHEVIDEAIRVYDKLLIVLSEASLQSEWVMDELRKGFKAERDTGKRKLFPVRLTDYETLKRWVCRDSVSGKDLAEEVRQYFIPNFSNWKDHDSFESAFSRLLHDLRAA